MLNADELSGFSSRMTRKHYANVIGDASIAGTENLEGAEYHQTISFLKEFLDNQAVN